MTFKYNDIEISWDNARDVVHHIDDQQFIQIVRDKKLESTTTTELIGEHEMVLIGSIHDLKSIPGNLKISHCFLIGEDPVDFSQYSIPILRKNGWKIEISHDYPYQIVDEPIGDWYLSIDEGSSYDWFNLELGITLKGEKINLLPAHK